MLRRHAGLVIGRAGRARKELQRICSQTACRRPELVPRHASDGQSFWQTVLSMGPLGHCLYLGEEMFGMTWSLWQL